MSEQTKPLPLTKEQIEERKQWWQAKFGLANNMLAEEQRYWQSEIHLCDTALIAHDQRAEIERLTKENEAMADKLLRQDADYQYQRADAAERLVAELEVELAALKHDIARHVAINAGLETELAEWRRPCEDVDAMRCTAHERQSNYLREMVPAEYARKLAAKLRAANERLATWDSVRAQTKGKK